MSQRPQLNCPGFPTDLAAETHRRPFPNPENPPLGISDSESRVCRARAGGVPQYLVTPRCLYARG